MEDESGLSPRQRGSALLREGRFDEAVAALREAIADDDTDAVAWRTLGAALGSAGDPDGAIGAFRQAAVLQPDSAKNQFNLGLALETAERTDEAKECFEKALALDPNYAPARAKLTAPAPEPPAAAVPEPVVAAPPPVPVAPPVPIAPPVPETAAPRATPAAVGLAPIGGFSAIGGGTTPALPPPAAPPPSGPAPGGGLTSPVGPAPLGGLSQPGGGAAPTPPGSYTPPPPVLGQRYGAAIAQNTSGMKGDVPEEAARGFNWGAFLLSWIWLCAHGMVPGGLGLLGGSFVLGLIAGVVKVTSGFPFDGIVNVAALGLQIWLGINGNKLAWRNRRFESVDDFRQCEKVWTRWGAGLILGIIVLAILGALLFPILVLARQKATQGG
jgi:hypothetical protein